MAKTKFQKEYIKRIDALNDQLWYFLFTSEELNRQLSNYSAKAKEVFTTDLFQNNQYSKRIHVKATNLISHQDENKKLTFGSYFSTCYEIASNYIKDIFDELKTINNLSAYTWNNQKEPEKNLKSLFTNNGLSLPPTYIFDTFTYLRLRRNHFTHIIETPNNKLTTFVSSNGSSLNNKWRTPGVVQSIDFTSLTNISSFTQEETIDLIKVLRICLFELDEYVASILNTTQVIKRLVTEEFGSKAVKMNSEVRSERNKKIIYKARTLFGLVVNETVTTPFVTTIGVR